MGSTLLSLSNDLATAVDRAGASVVAVNARPRTPSSGVVWRPGVVVTADHTTERDDEITLTFTGGKSTPARLAGRDPSTDLAVIQFDGDAPPAVTADTGTLRVGHLVLAVGRGVSASLGTVSSIGGPWRTWRGGNLDHFVKLDLAIYTGFSGGALVDAEGRVAGINTSGLARGLATAVPVSTVNRVVDELLARGHVARGYLGVGMHPVRLPDGRGGVIVLSVEPEAPASKAGVLVGDVIVALDGRPVTDTDDVQSALSASPIGKAILANVIRAGTAIEIGITVGERPRGV